MVSRCVKTLFWELCCFINLLGFDLLSLSLFDLADRSELEPGEALGPKACRAFIMF